MNSAIVNQLFTLLSVISKRIQSKINGGFVIFYPIHFGDFIWYTLRLSKILLQQTGTGLDYKTKKEQCYEVA